MNRLAFAGAAMAVLLLAAVAYAASPSAAPYASPGATTAPKAAASPAAKGSPEPSWTAAVNPVQVTGSATIQAQADGTGLLTLRLSGMVNEAPWTVDVDAGSLDRPLENASIAHKSGDEVKKIQPDTIQVRLTVQEMNQFSQALKANGVVIYVSDGTRLSAAVVAPQ